MRFVPRHWSNELWVCSMRGHCLPAAEVSTVRPEDAPLGIDAGGRRFARCLRCDAWIEHDAPQADRPAVLGPFAELRKPRRGSALQDAILLRLIAIDRGVHAVAFAILAGLLAWVQLNLSTWQAGAQTLHDQLQQLVGQSGQDSSRDWLVDQLERVAGLHHAGLRVLMITAVVYSVVEGVEAVGLWREKRWAEYLTALATVGFMPFEIEELIKRVTVLRVGALVVNVAVLVWLVWSKHLFGLRGGAKTLEAHTDWDAILGPTATL